MRDRCDEFLNISVIFNRPKSEHWIFQQQARAALYYTHYTENIHVTGINAHIAHTSIRTRSIITAFCLCPMTE